MNFIHFSLAASLWLWIVNFLWFLGQRKARSILIWKCWQNAEFGYYTLFYYLAHAFLDAYIFVSWGLKIFYFLRICEELGVTFLNLSLISKIHFVANHDFRNVFPRVLLDWVDPCFYLFIRCPFCDVISYQNSVSPLIEIVRQSLKSLLSSSVPYFDHVCSATLTFEIFFYIVKG